MQQHRSFASLVIIVISLSVVNGAVISAKKGQGNGGDLAEYTRGAVEFLSDPITAVFFIVQFLLAVSAKALIKLNRATKLDILYTQNLALGVFWAFVSGLVWDQTDTRADEELNLVSQINFFTDPQVATTNIYITLGTAAVAAALWALPTVLWSGQPLNDGVDDDELEGGAAADSRISHPDLLEKSTLSEAWRRLTCPNCVLNITLINTLFVSITKIT